MRNKLSGGDGCQIMKNCGAIAAEHAEFLSHFCNNFGEHLFETRQIPARINFLVGKVSAPTTLMSSVSIGTHKGMIWLSDQKGDFRNMSVAITNEAEDGNIFSIREFSIDPAEVCGESITLHGQVYLYALNDPSAHWNFSYQDGEVEIFSPSDAFSEPYKTRAVANMIVWASNILGFNAH